MSKAPDVLYEYQIIDGDLHIYTLQLKNQSELGCIYHNRGRKINYSLTPYRDEYSWLEENNVFLYRFDILVDVGDIDYDEQNTYEIDDVKILFEDEFGDQYTFELDFEDDDKDVS